jgi:Subtilase family
MSPRHIFLLGSVLPIALLSGCGGDSGGGTVASTPTPPQTPASPPPAPPPSSSFNTAEYQRSNAAVQAQALVAYQAGATGQGVVAAVIDSGINQNSAEFSGRISSLSADLAGSRGLQDVGGHGTAVSSVLLGAKNDSQMHGIAFNATLLVARTDTPGSCNDPASSDSGCTHDDNAIGRGVDLAVQARARVINISLGGSPPNSNLKAAIGRATAAGIIIVISAGNDYDVDPVNAANPDLLAQVALDPVARGLVLIAGATDSTQTIASFSNRAGTGQQYYLTALGVRVLAPDETGTLYYYSGTSFSAPVVAGAVALLAQAFPTLTGSQIVDLLLRTTTDLGATGTDSVYGRGELNLAKAFAPQGATSLSNSAVPVSLTSNGTLSAAMGDATQAGLAVPITDIYGRGFTVDLSPTLARAPRPLTLAPALADRTLNLSASGSGVTLALSVAERQPERLLLSRDQLTQARAIAGSIATRLGPNTQMAMGIASGADGLDRALSAQRAPSYLVADNSRGLEKAPTGAFALRQDIGSIALTLAGENGDLRLWERGNLGPRGNGYRLYEYDAVTLGIDGDVGPFGLGGRLTRMNEAETILGARFEAALGGRGATSWFADARATFAPITNWHFGASVRRGWTLIPAGVARGNSTITTQALTIEATRTSLFGDGDSLSLRWAEPLRVTGGGIRLTDIGLLSLAPEGHERNLEAVYASPAGPGWLTINSYWRQQPNNFAAAPNDLGAAVRYSFGF